MKNSPTPQHSNALTSYLFISNWFSDFRLALPLVRIQDIPKAITHQVKAHDDD